MVRKYQLPNFLVGTVDQKSYEWWLRAKGRAQVQRDRKRGNANATGEEYYRAIHKAVVESNGRDRYTGEMLDWSLISTYDNQESKRSGRVYKARFAKLPTVDHIDDGLGPANFAICGWRTNDAKSDMSHDEFVALCRRVISWAGDSNS